MDLLEKINGKKTAIGVVLASLLWIVVSWDASDDITWDTRWVQIAAALIFAWTGVALNHKAEKLKDALKSKGRTR